MKVLLVKVGKKEMIITIDEQNSIAVYQERSGVVVKTVQSEELCKMLVNLAQDVTSVTR